MSILDKDILKHIANMDADQEKQERSEVATDKVYDALVVGDSVVIDGKWHSIDDFVADVDIDSGYFCAFINTNDESLRATMIDKLYTFAAKLAEEIIKGEK